MVRIYDVRYRINCLEGPCYVRQVRGWTEADAMAQARVILGHRCYVVSAALAF